MKKLLIPAALVATFLATAVLPSCKKDDNSPTRSEMLVGSWKTVEQGSDDNNNGSWDASEHETIAAADVTTSKFNSDGSGTTTGSLSGVPITISFKWNLQNSDNDIRLIADFLGTTDTTIQSFVTFTSSDMVLKDNSSHPADFVSMKKQ